jgi:hypothetical protein
MSSYLLNKSMNNNVWVVDSDATNHMTNCAQNIQNLEKYATNQYFNVANGSKISIQGQGTTKIFDRNVSEILYLPDLTTNLLSVHRLCQELNCNVIFSSKKVVFEDNIMWRKISEGSEINGFYIIHNLNQALYTPSNIGESRKLLHWRPGHPSDKTLNNIFQFSNKCLDS